MLDPTILQNRPVFIQNKGEIRSNHEHTFLIFFFFVKLVPTKMQEHPSSLSRSRVKCSLFLSSHRLHFCMQHRENVPRVFLTVVHLSPSGSGTEKVLEFVVGMWKADGLHVSVNNKGDIEKGNPLWTMSLWTVPRDRERSRG